MKICAIICEFNPFHNGHAHLINEAKRLSGCDAVLCIMSGAFTQRGEPAVLSKYARAKHAILCGADAVIELPVSFAVAPAQIFAEGAVKILSSVESVKYLAFGCESGDGNAFTSAARLLINENAEFSATLREELNSGESYIKSYCRAFEAQGGNSELLKLPNNILGLEYCKAIIKCGADITPFPVRRAGADYSDGELKQNFSSSSALRKNKQNPLIKENMPPCSYSDFLAARDISQRFKQLCTDFLFICEKEKLKRVYGCSEGLENLLQKLAAENDYDGIIEKACSKRYTQSRIRRILTANLLSLYAEDTREFLSAELPVRILAVNKERADEILPALSFNAPQSEAFSKCAELTTNAYKLWCYLSRTPAENPNEKMILV